MNKQIKFTILSFLVFFLLGIVMWYLLAYLFPDLGGAYRALLTGGLTAILAPRVEERKGDSVSEIQLNWIFLKKPVSL